MGELTIVVFITGLIMSSLATLALWGAAEFRKVQSKTEANREVMRLETILRNYISQALFVSAQPLPEGGIALGNSPGRFAADFLYDEMSDWTTDPKPVAMFLREDGFQPQGAAASTMSGTPVATGLFLKAPEPASGASPTGTAGVLFIDNGAEDNVLEPDYGDIWFAGITAFELRTQAADRPLAGQTMLKSVTISFTLRFHYTDGLEQTWCPTRDIDNGVAGCTAGEGFFDIQRDLRVSLRNNDLYLSIAGQTDSAGNPSPGWVRERPAGFLHFFKPVFPDDWL